MRISPLLRFRCLLRAVAGTLLIALLVPGVQAEPKSKKPGKSKATKSKVQSKPFPPGPAAMAERMHEAMSAHMQAMAGAARQAEAEGPFSRLPFPPPLPFANSRETVSSHYEEPRQPRYREPEFEPSPAPRVYPDERRMEPYADRQIPPYAEEEVPYGPYQSPRSEPYPYGPYYEENPERIYPGPQPAPERYPAAPPRSRETPRPPVESPRPPAPAPHREPHRDSGPVHPDGLDLPYATPVPGTVGFVTIDGYPTQIDVRGIAPGTAVEIPDPNHPDGSIQFRVP
jgi:hypothetical protein